MSVFQKATKQQLKLRMANIGVSGSGKTYTSLALASSFGNRIAVIDSEHGKSALYADRFGFDMLNLYGDSDPRTYTKAIRAAGTEGYDVIIVDSLTHAWDGALQLKDSIAKRSRSGDSFGAWREVTPIFAELIDTILASPAHVICTMRQKTAYEVSKDDRTGKNKVEKLGLAPEFRSGVEYEFDIVADMDLENNWIVTKTRYAPLHGKVLNRPGQELATELLEWLNSGDAPVVPQSPPAALAPVQAEEPMETGEVADDFTIIALRNTIEELEPAFQEQVSSRWRWGSVRKDARKRLLASEAGDAEAAVYEVRDKQEKAYTARKIEALNAMKEVGITSEKARHEFVKQATGGATESTKQLSKEQLDAIKQTCIELGRADETGGDAA